MQSLTVQQFDSVMDVQQTNFIARHFIGFHPRDDQGIDTRPGITYGNTHAVARLGNADGHHAFAFATLNTVYDGVLNQRLDQQAGNHAVHLIINIVDNGQLVAKTRLLNGDVVLNLIQLPTDIYLLIVF